MEKRVWWKECAAYQIYPKSFYDSNGDGIGDINGIRSKLDYLKWLGIELIWISPMYESPGYDNGYDISNYEAIGSQFGSMEDFECLLEEAHSRGLRVVMDLVVNHTSCFHPWFIESKSSRSNPKRDYYIWRDAAENALPNNWGALFGGPAWTWDEGSKQYYMHLFSSHQPDLNWEHQPLREEIYAMMRRWLDKGIDGFRMDVISLLAKPRGLPDVPDAGGLPADPRSMVANNPMVHVYLQEMRQKALGKYDVVAIGEASGVTLEEAKKYTNPDGSELDMVFQFEHMDLDGGETFKWNDRKISLPELKQVLSRWQNGLEGKGWNALFWNNHDQPRMLSRLGDDGIYWEKSAKMLATCLFFFKGTPFIFQGEEIGMLNMPFTSATQLRDIESIDAYRRHTQSGQISNKEMLRFIQLKSRDNARTPMQWDSNKNAGFTAGIPWMDVNPNFKTINVNSQRRDERSILAYYRKLIRLRKAEKTVIYGRYADVCAEDPHVFAYMRILGDCKIFIACNFSGHQVYFPYKGHFCNDSHVLIGNEEQSTYQNDEKLRPFEAIVLKSKLA